MPSVTVVFTCRKPIYWNSTFAWQAKKPMEPSSLEVTQLLLAYNNGDEQALERLFPLVYDELRRLAGRYLKKERDDHTLQATALVHEAYLRLVDQNVSWQNRAHFFGVAAQMMRRILVDHARHNLAAKRGSGGIKLSLDESIDLSDERASDLIALDEALNALNSVDPAKRRMVELRYFGGLSVEDTAKILNISVATYVREWRKAKAFLYNQITK
jgi:RNA polymerase sigma factor (TIGR02999 family)